MSRILVIDDEPDVLNIIVEILKTAGYEVVAAANGEAGLKALDGNPFDLVFTDLMMPGIGGMDVLQHIATQSPVMERLKVLSRLLKKGPSTILRSRLPPKPC